MSIVALKRKTYAQYHNMSVGSPQGFSLNGTHRNQGYVGQTSLSRFLSRTTMRNGAAKGYGGCCGQYIQKPIVQSAVTSVENSSVVKSSVLNTKGMLDTRNRWARRGEPYISVKPDNNQNLNTQKQYIEELKKKTIQQSCSVVSDTKKYISNGCSILGANERPRLNRITRYCKLTTKPEQSKNKETNLPYSVTAMDYQKYITELHKKCADLNIVSVPSTLRRVPLGICKG